jgi:hypothetical protein
MRSAGSISLGITVHSTSNGRGMQTLNKEAYLSDIVVPRTPLKFFCGNCRRDRNHIVRGLGWARIVDNIGNDCCPHCSHALFASRYYQVIGTTDLELQNLARHLAQLPSLDDTK